MRRRSRKDLPPREWAVTSRRETSNSGMSKPTLCSPLVPMMILLMELRSRRSWSLQLPPVPPAAVVPVQQFLDGGGEQPLFLAPDGAVDVAVAAAGRSLGNSGVGGN